MNLRDVLDSVRVGQISTSGMRFEVNVFFANVLLVKIILAK